MTALGIIPTYVTSSGDLEVLRTCLESLRATEPDLSVLIVDDGSPDEELVGAMDQLSDQFKLEFHAKEENTGFARTVNVGLRRALEDDSDAILINADIEFIDAGWVARMEAQETQDGSGPASIVGARLLYPNGLIQHGGVYFSLLHRCFEHVHKFAPHDLPEAMTAKRLPVTGALQFLRNECLAAVGIYDEDFKLGWEDVDYCIRAFQSGRECIYQPRVRAYHHESYFRARPSPKIEGWTAASWAHFCTKYQSTSFAEWVPSIV